MKSSYYVLMSTRRIIHAFDAGPALALQPLGLEKRFHGWRGKSGRRYLSTIFVGASVRHLGMGVYLMIRRSPAGDLIPMHVGLMSGAEAIALRESSGADEIHVIFPAEDQCEAVSADLASVMAPLVEACAAQPVSQSN